MLFRHFSIYCGVKLFGFFSQFVCPVHFKRLLFCGHQTEQVASVSNRGRRLPVSPCVENLSPNVRVNVVAPSLTKTQLAEPLTRSPQMAEAIAKQHPMQRMGEA